jgi:hypothetical protein
LAEGGIADTTATPYTISAVLVVETTQSLPLGTIVNATLAAPSEQDRYTFTLAAVSQLYFDSLTNNGNFRWSLSGPNGTPVSLRTFTSSDAGNFSSSPTLALPAGTYTLTVSGLGTTTGAYSFRLLDLSQGTALTPGTPVSGTLSPANSTAVYHFSANAGDTYYFARQAGSGSDFWRLLDPYGNQLFGVALTTDGGRLTLSATGTYTLLAEGNIGDTTATPYTVNVTQVADTTQSLTSGSTVSGNLVAPSQQDRYTFTLAAASQLYFDSLTNNGNFRWSLSGPNGTSVSNRTFTASDDSGISGTPALVLPAGTYTLTVSAATPVTE